MGMDLYDLTLRTDPYDGKERELHSLSWSMWHDAGDFLTELGCDTSEMSESNDGEIVCAETAHAWAKAIIGALDSGTKFTPEKMVNWNDADVWLRELAEALASSNGVKQY